MSLAVTAVFVAAVGTGYSIYSGERAASQQAAAQRQAKAQAEAQAEKDAKAADEANNRANQKDPNTNALLSASRQAGKLGGASTLLTGPTGIDTSALSLGRSTLLGG